MNLDKFKVIAPESFVPKNSDQDIAVMAPLFALYDSEIDTFNKYTIDQSEDRQMILKWATEDFYRYGIDQPSDPANLEWQTLTRWRYRNESQYKNFLIFLSIHNKHQAELEQLRTLLSEACAKSNHIDSVFSKEQYQHHSGTIYKLLAVANTTATKTDYPVSAVYMNIDTGEVFVRPYEDFKSKTKHMKA